MSMTLTIEVPVSFQPVGRGGRKELRAPAETPPLSPGRVPRVSRLMALALRLHELLRTDQVRSCGELASLGHVTRARICQILNLLCLAPDIQEALLFPPPTLRGRDAIILADLLPIAAAWDWRTGQRWPTDRPRWRVSRFHPLLRILSHYRFIDSMLIIM